MADNLSEVLGCWRNQKHGAGLPGDLDLRKARSQVRPRLSPRSDSLVYYGRVHLSPVIESHASGIFFASVYVGFIAIVGPRRFRKWLGLLSVTLLTASLLAPNARALAVKVPWPHRGYVSDFIYVRGFDWSTQEDRSERIIAYEKRPWGVSKKRRVVGFANWGVHLVPEHIFQRLAAEQGIILPEPRRPASGIEPTAEDQ